jgi:hypothetical protein
VAILFSGLTITITAGVTIGTQAVAALTLLLASLIPFRHPNQRISAHG